MRSEEFPVAASETAGADSGPPRIYHSEGYGAGEFIGVTRDEVVRWLLGHCGKRNVREEADRILAWFDLDPGHGYYGEHGAAGWNGNLHCFWRVGGE